MWMRINSRSLVSEGSDSGRNRFLLPISRRWLFLHSFTSFFIATTIYLTGCALSSSSHQENPPPVKVTITPGTSSLFLGQIQPFAASVANAANAAINWTVNGISGGNSAVGTIVPSSPGLDAATYTVPQVLPSPANIVIAATSQADASASGSASVQIESDVAVSIAPASTNVETSTAQSFSAKISATGNPSIAVTWSVNGISGGNSAVGSIIPIGANTANYVAPTVPPSPPNVSVTATSVADPSKSASASVTVTCASARSISPSSANVQTGTTQNFEASFCTPVGTPIIWDVNGVAGGSSALGTVTASNSNPSVATYTAPASIPLANPVAIHAAAGGQSASATVTIINPPAVAVSVSPSLASVPASQRTNFVASVSGTQNTAVTWSVDGVTNGNSAVGQVCASSSSPCVPPTGDETSIDFLAPQVQPQPSTVTLTAISVADPASTGSAQITITTAAKIAVSVAPFYMFLDPSQQFQFVANVSGAEDQSVTWSVSSAVQGQGCSGISCGTIDGSGDFTAPAAAPSPNAISVTATSVANPSASATATVALLSGPVIETILPSSVLAGAPNSFLLAVQGLNFVPTTSSGSSRILINGVARSTNCPIPGRCTTALQPTDVAAPGVISAQVENPGAIPALSNPVSVVVLANSSPPGAISLTNSSPLATGANIVVTETTTSGATPSQVNVDFAGPVSADGSTCTIQGSPIVVTRPASAATTVNICVHGNFLDPTLTYAFSSPSTGGDIDVVPSALGGLFPNLIELNLTFSSNTVPGVRSLFITTPNGDVAVASGLLEVK